jgi:hypothetical protein
LLLPRFNQDQHLGEFQHLCDRFDPPQNQLGVRLADGESAHCKCVGVNMASIRYFDPNRSPLQTPSNGVYQLAKRSKALFAALGFVNR